MRQNQAAETKGLKIDLNKFKDVLRWIYYKILSLLGSTVMLRSKIYYKCKKKTIQENKTTTNILFYLTV